MSQTFTASQSAALSESGTEHSRNPKYLRISAGLTVGADEDFTTHVLRHTLGTTLARRGVDVVTIAELLGHSLETARRYTLPTHADRQAAIDSLTIDE